MNQPAPVAYVAGPLFLDIVLGPLEHEPRPGEEQWVDSLAVVPGGVANQGTALARLGFDTRLLTTIGVDDVGGFTRELTEKLDLGLGYATEVARQNVTAALVMGGDRSFTTFGSPHVPPPPAGIDAPTVLLAPLTYLESARDSVSAWRSDGAMVIADAAWDDTGEWPITDLDALNLADVFVPNDVEAMNYTRTASAADAARALGEKVPTVVVTTGSSGSIVRTDSKTRTIPSVGVDALDTTGAGDAFAAGLAAGLVAGLEIDDAVVLGSVTAAYTVQRLGGSTATPTLAELTAWATTLGEPYSGVVSALGGASVHRNQR